LDPKVGVVGGETAWKSADIWRGQVKSGGLDITCKLSAFFARVYEKVSHRAWVMIE
jgi:hypothetical protein